MQLYSGIAGMSLNPFSIMGRGIYRYFFWSRRVELERRLLSNKVMTQERKQRQLVELGRKESEFLRLRRIKIGVHDFGTVKVIGKGAFGEVNSGFCSLLASSA